MHYSSSTEAYVCEPHDGYPNDSPMTALDVPTLALRWPLNGVLDGLASASWILANARGEGVDAAYRGRASRPARLAA